MGELGGLAVKKPGAPGVSEAPSILSLFRRPIYYHPALARLMGDAAGAVFLSAIAAYQGEIGEENWWNRTSAQWEAETGLSLAQQSRIRERLRSLGLLEEKPGVGQVPLSRVNVGRLIEFLVPGVPCVKKNEGGTFDVGTIDSMVERLDELKEKRVKSFVPEDAILPFGLQHPEFEAAWRDWCKDRRDRRRLLTPLAVKGQLAVLDGIASRFGWKVAVTSVRQAIEAGWARFYEPKPDSLNGRGYAPPPSSGPQAIEPTRGSVELARHRLIEAALHDASTGRISQEKLDEILESAKTASTLATLDLLGRDVPSWSNGGGR